MILAILHTREYDDYEHFARTLDRLRGHGLPKITKIVVGAARSGELLALRYAQAHHLPVRVIKPNYIKFGRQAPWVRNGQVLAAAQGLVAFHDGQSKNTAHAIQLARAKPLRYVVVVPVELRPRPVPAPSLVG